MLEVQQKSLKVGKFVTTEHVDTVIKNYKQERWVHNSQRLGKEDSLSIWYSVEELEEFLMKAKEYGADGVRMYFGAYDKEYAEKPLYEGRQTIVLVATKEKETETGSIDKNIYVSNNQGTSILAYNAGRPCPPLCSTIGDGSFGDIGITIIDKGADGLVVA